MTPTVRVRTVTVMLAAAVLWPQAVSPQSAKASRGTVSAAGSKPAGAVGTMRRAAPAPTQSPVLIVPGYSSALLRRLPHPAPEAAEAATRVHPAFRGVGPRGTATSADDRSSVASRSAASATRSGPAPEQPRSAPPNRRPTDAVLVWKPGGITPVTTDAAAARHDRLAGRRPLSGRMPIRVAAEPDPPVDPVVTVVPIFVPLDRTIVRSFDIPTNCASQLRQRPERRRFPWGLGWLQRYGRDVDVERGAVVAPSFYLRSPLLSGLYRGPEDCPPEVSGPEEHCAIVTLVADDDAAIAFEVPLPQFDARTPRQLRDAIREALAAGETVVITTTDGEEFDLMPGAVREIDATSCRLE